MMKDSNAHERGRLPEDLRALDAELSSIRYEERPSFGPELRAELARALAEGEIARPGPVRRYLAAAVVAALLVGGAAVPSARASLVRLMGMGDAPAEVEATPPAEAPAPEASAPEPEPSGPIAAPAAPTFDAPAPIAEPATVVTEPVIVAPRMLDRLQAEELLQSVYPLHLQRRGVGGTVWVTMWVDEFGAPGSASVARTSGSSELDRAAVRAVPRLRFEPATQNGRRTGTWIEFPVLFEPDPERVERTLAPVIDPLSLPTIVESEWWQLRDPLDLEGLPPVAEIGAADDRARAEATEGLRRAVADPAAVDRWGPPEAILGGEAPNDMPPTEWRAAVGAAFDDAIERGTETPVSLLALGRVRIRQGLRAEARSLFERGLQIAIRDPAEASDWVVAELHYERGSLVRDRWRASDGIGRVRSEAFGDATCAPASSSGRAASGFASVERLIAWNYLCPGEMEGIFRGGFDASSSGSAGDLTLMMASLRAALEAYPGHVGANTDLLVTLAERERWSDVLAGSLRFARQSAGHPDALLLAGIALHRLGRSEEAAEHFDAALARMDEMDADELLDISYLLDGAEIARYQRAAPPERRTVEDAFWPTRDRVPATAVNERRVEHLARTAYAKLRFGTVFGDAAEVWVRFGRPNNVHIVDEGTGRLTEFWNYGSGPDITFVRWVSTKRTDLTPEGRAYVDDLGKIFPPQ